MSTFDANIIMIKMLTSLQISNATTLFVEHSSVYVITRRLPNLMKL